MERGTLTEAAGARAVRGAAAQALGEQAAAEITFTTANIVDCDVALPLDRLAGFLAAMTPRLVARDPGAEGAKRDRDSLGAMATSITPPILVSDDPALRAAIRADICELAVAMGGSFSAEHAASACRNAPRWPQEGPGCAGRDARDQGRAGSLAGLLNPGKVLP